MHIPTHILSGWCVGNCFRIGPRERLFCMIAAAAADIDGLGILFGEEMYWRFHHSLGHNVFYGAMLAGAMAIWSARPYLCFVLYLVLFHLHLLMDFFGSGIGWKIHYLWPLLMQGWKTNLAWNLSAWPNYLAFLILLLWTALIALRYRRTPLELIAPRLNDKLLPHRA